MDAADLKLGHRVYNKNGKLMAIDLNRQVDILNRQDAANWPTPDASNHRDGEVLRKDNNLEQGGFHGVSLHHAMTKYGQAAPANHNTDGSRQESWRTPSSSDGEGGVMEMREGCAGQYKLRDHVVAEQKLWRTPSAAEEKNQNTSTQIYLQNQVGATPKAWATPRSGKTTDENPETWAARQAKGDVATMPLTAQVKQWATATVSTGAHRQKDGSMTPKLDRQVSGKLNPRWVETLMGLPVGWVMPSCKSPVTIEPTNFDYSATESCLQQQSELLQF